jgi:hypothetical protein
MVTFWFELFRGWLVLFEILTFASKMVFVDGRTAVPFTLRVIFANRPVPFTPPMPVLVAAAPLMVPAVEVSGGIQKVAFLPFLLRKVPSAALTKSKIVELYSMSNWNP